MVWNEVCFQFGMEFAPKARYLEGQGINRIALPRGHYDFVFQPTISQQYNW